jgi:hypothetical protein
MPRRPAEASPSRTIRLPPLTGSQAYVPRLRKASPPRLARVSFHFPGPATPKRPWPAVQLLEQLGLGSVLKGLLPEGRQEIPWAVMGMVPVIARFCDPSGELYIAEQFYRRAASYHRSKRFVRRPNSCQFVVKSSWRLCVLVAHIILARRLCRRYDIAHKADLHGAEYVRNGSMPAG